MILSDGTSTIRIVRDDMGRIVVTDVKNGTVLCLCEADGKAYLTTPDDRVEIDLDMLVLFRDLVPKAFTALDLGDAEILE